MDKTTTLPTANLSDTRMDDFWSNIDPGLTQPKPEPRDLDVGVSDLARATGAGGLELVGGIGELARQAANYGRTQGGKDQGDYLENARANMAAKLAPALDVVAGVGGLAQSSADSLIDGMSADAKEAMSRSLVTETPQGRLELGDGIGDIDVWAMKMAQGVGSLLPTLLSGGVTGVAARVTVGRMVTASMIKRGVSQEVAEAVAAKTVSRLATGAATTTGVTGSVGSAGVNAFDSVQAMSFDELSNSTTFRDAFHRIDGDPQLAHISDSDKLAMAREETANLASQATMGDAKTWGAAAVGTLMGDTMLFKMLAVKGAGSGVIKGVAKGAAGEGVSEALEEGTQQYSVNEALNEVAGTNIDPMSGVVSAAIENGLIGVGVGGSTGGVSGLRGKRVRQAVDDLEQTPMQEVPAHEQAEPVASAQDEATTDPLSQPAQGSPLGPSSSQFDELRDVPAYLRQDDTADRFNGLADDSEVQRALAGEFGPSVQELVAAQMQGGDQGKSLYERVQSGELGIDPFTGNKSAQQVAMENQRPALPLKDVIFAGDANAKPKGEEVAAPGDHDDHQAGTGPQFRGDERTRWQSGQEGDLLPPETATVHPAGELLGAVIEGEAREVGTELPHRDVVYGTDQRQPDTKPMRGSATESAIGPLQTLRITRKGKPFATEREAAMASRKGQETPVPLNGGGFGVAAIEEVELAKGSIADLNKVQGHEQVAGVDSASSEGQGDQQPAGAAVSALAGAEAGMPSELPASDRERGPTPDAARDEGLHDDNALTTPAEAGVDVSGPVTTAEGEPAQQIEAARAEVATDPSDAQKEAGNYKKGHLKLHGLDIALENPKGSTRSGTDPDGKSWQSTMVHDYGYIKRTEGADGDHVDVFIGDKPENATVYVVDQVDPNTGKFDEHKVMMGFDSEQAAREGYLANYEKGWKGFGSIKAMQVEEFKRWVKGGDTTKPANDWSGAKSAADYHAAKRRLFSGEMEFSEFQAMSRSALDNAPSLRAELEKKTKQDLLDQMSRFNVARYKNDKKAVVVEAAYNQLIGDLRWAANGDGNTISETYAIGAARQSIEERVAKALNDLTPERYQLFRDKQLSDVAEMQRRREDLKRSLTDPQTLDDFKAFIERRGIDKLTLEQRARYEDMVVARNLDRREQEHSAKGNETAHSATSSGIIKTKHTKTGDDLFVVQMGDRVERGTYNRINAHAKTLGGWYSSFRGKGAVPGFQFKSEDKATEFSAWLGGEVGVASQEVAPDQSTDSEAQPAGKSKQVEALRNRAASARAKAEAVFNADRKENTARRASMAANARANAERDLLFAGLLEAIATGIESGEITYLRNLANGAQLEELQLALNRGLWSLPATKIDALVSNGVINRDDSSRYSWSDKATPEQMVEGVSMPGMDYHTDRLREVALKMQGASGFKQAGAKVMSLVKAAENRDSKTTTLSDPELIAKLKAYVNGSDDYSTIKDQIAGYGRLERMGITNHTELRAALRELVRLRRGLNETAPQRDPVTEKTNALKRRLLNNRNDFIDFFPTPEEFAADLVDRLGIEPGMVVLEPSAGHGMLAEAARDAGATVEAVELAGDLRDILHEKGFSLVGNDFMETTPSQRYDAVIMNPPFSNDMDIDHVRHAFGHLKPGGRLAAIVSSMAGQRSNKKNKAFREWLDDLGASEEMMPEGAFKDSLNPTSVRTKIITIEKPVDSAENSDATEQRAVSFSKQAQIKGEQPPAKHLTRKEAEMVTRGWLKQYRGVDGIDIQIHATQAEMEKALGLPPVDGLIRRAAFDRSESGLHVAANTITSPHHLREILRHEVLAHYGLANVLGGSRYTSLISKVISSQGNASMKGVWEWVQTHYGDEPAAVQAEEVIAHLAELEPSAWRRGWDKVVSWVTQALRAVGFAPEGITAAEIRSMIEALGKKLEVGSKESSSDLDGQWFSAERTPWKPGFPEVVLHGRLGDATAHPDYEAAKGGDDAAARRLVSDVLSRDAIRQLKGLIGDREAIALGVHAEEAVSRNAIPRAMADVLATVLGMDVDLDIVQAAKVGRTAQDGFGRLANQPSFDGPVRTNKPYLIMDDTLTQGGTLANLKGYIEAHGGEVLAATALTGKQYSAKIAIDSSTLEQLRDQYDGTGLEAWWHNRFGYGFDSLTESEARYLLRAKDADKIRDRVTAAGQLSPTRGEHESARDDGSLPPDGLKFSQAVAADEALQKLNLGRKPDIIDRTQERLSALRGTDRTAVKSWVDRFIKKANTEMLDALAPIKYAEDAAGITDARESGYIAARMASGAASTMQATMLYGLPEWKDGVIQRKAGTGESDALLGIFEGLGKDLHNWLGWMAGHRAEILMAEGRENLLTEQDIAALKSLDKGKESQFQEAKRKWNTLNASVLDLAEEAGLFSADDRAKWESEWYIPFFREGEDGDAMAPFKARGVANQSAGIKKLKGGTANTNDLLENIFTSTSKLIDASMKNMAAQKTVWNLADTGIIEVVARPNMMDWRALKNGKDLITVKLEGEDYMIRVEDPELYRAMTFFDRQPHGKLVRMAASAKRLLTAGVTASPEFMLRNFLRDSLSAWAISKDGFKPMIDSIRGIRKTMKMGGSTIDVMFSGASFLGGHLNGNDPQAMADSVRKALHRKGMTPPQIDRYERSIIRNATQAQEVLGKVWDQYSKYGEALENANREAVYDAAIKAGKSHAQAAFEARDLMDFSMLGASRTMQTMVMLLPFFNARVQGLGKLGRELRDNPRGIAKRAGMITAASLALLALNWDDERYESLPDWDKDGHWHFWFGDEHWRIPKPFEVGILFGTIPERMARAMGDKDTGAQFGKAMARAFMETFEFNPIPQIAMPMTEAYINYDFFRGGAIENSAEQSVLPEARYSEHTSLLMRELGQLTGLSPKKLEHIVVGYTGTIGGYVLAAADGLIRAAQPGEPASWRADEIPLVKAVYRGNGPAKSTQHMEQFYEMLGEVNELKKTVDQYRKAGMTKEAQALLDEQGGILKARKALTQTQLRVRQLRNRLDLIQRDKTLSGEEKRQRIDAIFAKRNDLVYRAVERTKGLWE